jgi:hypothetical protein
MQNSGHTRFIDSKEQGNDINDNSEAISQGDGVFNVVGKLSSERRTLRIIESGSIFSPLIEIYLPCLYFSKRDNCHMMRNCIWQLNFLSCAISRLNEKLNFINYYYDYCRCPKVSMIWSKAVRKYRQCDLKIWSSKIPATHGSTTNGCLKRLKNQVLAIDCKDNNAWPPRQPPSGP